jgi:hypothetical protein
VPSLFLEQVNVTGVINIADIRNEVLFLSAENIFLLIRQNGFAVGSIC